MGYVCIPSWSYVQMSRADKLLYRYCSDVLETDPIDFLVNHEPRNFYGFLEWLIENQPKITTMKTVEAHWAHLRMLYTKETSKLLDKTVSENMNNVSMLIENWQNVLCCSKWELLLSANVFNMQFL